jgi:choloylglycine hydrolase
MCTSFRVRATDGTVVVGRTMEFPNAMGTRLTVLPRGFAGSGHAPSGDGLGWTAAHGAVGMDVFGMPAALTDGINEQGLYAGLLYMPGFCEYTPAAGAAPATLLSIVDAVAYVLGTCASVEEARRAMAAVTVWPWQFEQFGFAPPAHLVVHDAGGACAVFEWAHGEMLTFENPIGVVTNAPHLDWHLTNLRNYLTVSAASPQPRTIEGVELEPLGEGVGISGLPGGSSPPARFVRAVALTASLRPVPDGPALEQSALHVLNNFDIPAGLIRQDSDAADDDRTLWSSIANLTARRYAVRTYENPQVHVLDLADAPLDAPAPVQVELASGGFAAVAM